MVASHQNVGAHLPHRSEHLIAAPSLYAPIIVVLFDPTDANGAITTTAAAQKSTSRDVALASIET
jgi:hypothetical protein